MTVGVSDGSQFEDDFSLQSSYHNELADDQHDQDIHQALVGLGYPDDSDQETKPVRLAMSDLPGHPPLTPDVLGNQLSQATGGQEKPVGGSVKEPITLKEIEPTGSYRSKSINYTVHRGDEPIGQMVFRIHPDQPNIAKLEWAGIGDINNPRLDNPNGLGAGVVRQAFKAFSELHPEINRLYADRISGARAKSDPEGKGDTVGFKIENGRLKLLDDYKYFQDPDYPVEDTPSFRSSPSVENYQDLMQHPAFENPTRMEPFNTYDPQVYRQLFMPQANDNLHLEAQIHKYGLNPDLPNMIKNNPEMKPMLQNMQDRWNNPEELGITSLSNAGVMQEAAQMGQHADWDKFAREQRPSTNVEDDRERLKTIHEILLGLNPMDAIPNGISNIMYK